MSAGNVSFSRNPKKQDFHAFLSHNGADKSLVERLAEELEKRGLACWLDKWNLIPGDPWQPAIEEALAQCDTCVVFFGPLGLGPWHNEEMRLALQQRVNSRERKLRVLPVILPGGQRAKESDVPGFLQGTTWSSFVSPLMRRMSSTGWCAASKASRLGVDREPPSWKGNARTSG
jgi:hypothetical protein